jgi:RNA polymerase sigma factor (TIGR02999 family)
VGSSAPDSVTVLLEAVAQGRRPAEEQLIALIYRELRQMAAGELHGDSLAPHTSPTSLVHETYMRLLARKGVRWNSRRHFFGAAARAMKCILVEKARALNSVKRGGRRQQVPLDPELVASLPDPGDPDGVILLHDALDRLDEMHPLASEIFHLRNYAGLKVKEVALALEMSDRQVEKKTAFAMVFLRREIEALRAART